MRKTGKTRLLTIHSQLRARSHTQAMYKHIQLAFTPTLQISTQQVPECRYSMDLGKLPLIK